MNKFEMGYTYFFYRVSEWAKAFSDDNWHEWKAVLVISALEAYLFLGALFAVEVLIRHRIFADVAPLAIVVLSCILVNANYFSLIRKGRWRRYEKKFKSYSPQKNLKAGLLVIGITVAVLLSLLTALFAMSQIGSRIR